MHHFICHFVISIGDSLVMLVSTFGTYVTHLGAIGHLNIATHMHCTAYYPLRDRRWAICQVLFLTLSNTAQQGVHHFICHFVSANGDTQEMLVSTLVLMLLI